MFSLLGCFKKKETLASWLNENFTNRYEVVDTRMNLLPSIYKEKKRESVVALKADPEVQFEITWYKNAPGLRITKEEVINATEKSTTEVAQGRALFQAVQKNGLSKIAVAVIEDAAYFLIYDTPSPDNRKRYLQQVLTTIGALSTHEQTNIFVEFVEDSVYHKEFRDIIPRGYWNRADHYHDHHTLVSLDFKWSPDVSLDALMTGWAFNTKSDQCIKYMDDAFQLVTKWAEKNISGPYYIEQNHYVEYETDEHDPMAVHFNFPYFSSRPSEDGSDYAEKQKGFITGIYQVDQKTFTQIKAVKEL